MGAARRTAGTCRYKEVMTADVPPSTRPVTLEDVARVAGVSRATVSRVINGATTVDAALRQVVEEAIAATQYVPNRAARSLVTRRTDSIALVVSEQEQRSVATPFIGRMFTDPTSGGWSADCSKCCARPGCR